MISPNTVPLCVFEKEKGWGWSVYFSHFHETLHLVTIFPGWDTFLRMFGVLL